MKSVVAMLVLAMGLALLNAEATEIAPVLSDFEWVGRNCSMPGGRLPPPVSIDDPDHVDRSGRPKKIALRSKVDIDGDGICEVFDVMEEEHSNFTARIYGYPTRITSYVNGRWKSNTPMVDGWIPLVLEDKKHRSRAVLELNAGGNAGNSTAVGFQGADRCEKERLLVAASYLLLNAPPQELSTDPALAEAWTGPIPYVLTETF